MDKYLVARAASGLYCMASALEKGAHAAPHIAGMGWNAETIRGLANYLQEVINPPDEREMIETSISAAVADLSQLPPVNWPFWMARFLLELRDALENPVYFDAAWEQAKKRVEEVMIDGGEMS